MSGPCDPPASTLSQGGIGNLKKKVHMEAPPPPKLGGELAAAQVGLRNGVLDLEAPTPELGLPPPILLSDNWGWGADTESSGLPDTTHPGRALSAFSPQEILIPVSPPPPLPELRVNCFFMPPGCFSPQNSLWQSLWQPRTQLHFISSGYRIGGGEVDGWVQLGLSYPLLSTFSDPPPPQGLVQPWSTRD